MVSEIKIETKEEKQARIARAVSLEASHQFDQVVASEFEANPRSEAFLSEVKQSKFFRNLFLEGFVRGANWMDENTVKGKVK
jgi:hypothetical protein